MGILTMVGARKAQAQLAAYGMFSTAGQAGPNEPRLNGGTFGAYYDGRAWPVVHLGGDVRVSHESGSDSSSFGDDSLTSVLVGLRASAHVPLIPVRPYVEGLVGEGSFHDNIVNVTSRKGTAAEAGAAVGADLTILPHIDWRIVDFQYGRVYGDVRTTLSTVSTGLVVRLF